MLGLLKRTSPKLVNLPLLSNLGGKCSGGATFTRASGQWCQDDAGVWQYVGNNIPSFNSKGILLEPASTNKCTCYGAIPSNLGAELIVAEDDRTFASDTGFWTKGASCVIANGVASTTAPGAAGNMDVLGLLVAGSTYQVTFTVAGYVAGSTGVSSFTTNAADRYVNANGTFTRTFIANGTTPTMFRLVSDAAGVSFDNVSVKEVINLSAELITTAANRDFSSDTGAWTKEAGWTISGGGANATAITGSAALILPSLLVLGRVYTVTFTVRDYIAGNLRLFMSAGGPSMQVTGNAAYTFTAVASGTVSQVRFQRGDADFTGTIDDVSVKEVLYSAGTKTSAYVTGAELVTVADDRNFSSDTGFWTKSAGWTIASGVASAVSASTSLYRNLLVSGKMYQITYTLSGYAGGSLQLVSGTSTGISRTANGTYTESITVASTFLNFTGTTFTGSIDNVSVKEVTYNQNHTNITLSGDPAAILSTVDDTAALTAAGLLNLCPSGKVYKLDNSTGVIATHVAIGGPVANLNPHSLSAFGRTAAGAPYIRLNGLSQAVFAGAAYTLVKKDGATPNDVDQLLRLQCPAGAVLYFILPQLEELPHCTSPMPTAGSTATRAATALSLAAQSNIQAISGTIYMEVTPLYTAAAPQQMFFYHNNAGSRIYIKKNAASIKYGCALGSSASLVDSTTDVAVGITRKVALRWDGAAGVVAANGAISASTAYAALTSTGGTIIIGSDGAAAVYCYIKNLRIYRRPLNDAQLIAMTT